MLPEVVEDQTGLGTPLVTPKEGRLSHGLTKRFTQVEALGASLRVFDALTYAC